MHTHDSPHDTPPEAATGDRRVSAGRWVFGAFIAMAAFLLAFEHRAHLLGILPWLFLLACPLMHIFMHHGRGGHSRHDGDSKDRRPK